MKVGDKVVYKNKCMVVVGMANLLSEDVILLKDIVTGGKYAAHIKDVKRSDKCIDLMYKMGEIE